MRDNGKCVADCIKSKINKATFVVLSWANRVVPKKEKVIFMCCKDHLGWNGLALLQYLHTEGYLKKYRLICYTDRLEVMRRKYVKYKDVIFTNSTLKGYWMRLRAQYYFSGVLGERFACKPAKNQVCVQLWHGIALKALRYSKERQYMLKSFTHALCYSEFVAEIMKKDWKFDDSKVLISQNPRDDWMFRKKDCLSEFGIPVDRKSVMWLPTYRKKPTSLNFDSDIDFPILSELTIRLLDDFLAECNINLIIKLHPLQREVSFLKGEFRNIFLIQNADFDTKGCEFYEMIGQMDAMLSDYSSVAIDFMLLNRPIGYVIDDIEEYDGKRGFHVEEPLKFMPGHHIMTFQELKQFFADIADGKDIYAVEREQVNNLLNKYKDANNCKRVLEAVGIYK